MLAADIEVAKDVVGDAPNEARYARELLRRRHGRCGRVTGRAALRATAKVALPDDESGPTRTRKLHKRLDTHRTLLCLQIALNEESP